MTKTGFFELKAVKDSVENKRIIIPSKDNGEDDGKDSAWAEAELKEKNEKEADNSGSNDQTAVYDRSTSVMLTAIFGVVSLAVYYLLYSYCLPGYENIADKPFLYVKMVAMFFICAAAALTDYKRQIIPNLLILTGLGIRIVIYVLEFVYERDSFMSTLKNDGIGFLLGFVSLFVIAVIARGGLGFGDVKLFGVMGIMAGPAGMVITLILSLVLCSIASVILMAMHKKTIKSKLSMAPYIFAAFLTVCLLGAF